MAFTPFSKFLTVRVIADDSDVIFLGKINPDVNIELKHVRPFLYMQGAPTNETIRIGVHTSTNYSREYATSNTINLSDISQGNNTLSWNRFDFDKVILSANYSYYLSILTNGYTRNNDAFYLSFVYDYPVITNLNGDTQTGSEIIDFPKAFQLFGLKG